MLGSAVLFLIGYAGIIFEHNLKIDKAATALLTGIGCWILFFIFGPEVSHLKIATLGHHFSEISQVIFFLLGAMLIVECIDCHQGFIHLERLLSVKSQNAVIWIIMGAGFFMSSVLDNLTTIIVMISFLKKLIPDRKKRLFLSSALVCIVNAGGAWTPIGDITTTMLWIAGRITSISVMQALVLPCIATGLVTAILIQWKMPKFELKQSGNEQEIPRGSKLILFLGLGALMMVPILKATIELPPFMGMLLGVSLLWAITEILHSNNQTSSHLRIFNILKKIDLSSVLFFLGILLAIGALDSFGILKQTAIAFDQIIPSQDVFAMVLGVVSSIIDNVPLVAACIKMYGTDVYPIDHHYWNMIAYSAGVGGSLLVIGSAPGIALMSLEKVSFTWYLKNISLISLISFIVGFLFTFVFS